jgi:hypothetical protein
LDEIGAPAQGPAANPFDDDELIFAFACLVRWSPDAFGFSAAKAQP